MKELSIEQKAKRYDELLVKLQEAKVDNNVCDDRYCCVIDDIVPELKESEDERIRKVLVGWIKCEPLSSFEKGFSQEQILAWLEKQGEHANFRNKIQIGDKVTRNEDGVLVNLSQLNRVAKKDKKQGEQKPAEWSEKDEDTLHCIIDALDSLDIRTNTNGEHEDHTEEIYWLKSLKDRVQPQPKREWSEEDEYCRHQLIAFCENCMAQDACSKRCAHWLKSLRPQNTWKPSEEQMTQLKRHCPDNRPLTSLYEQLKKLMEK